MRPVVLLLTAFVSLAARADVIDELLKFHASRPGSVMTPDEQLAAPERRAQAPKADAPLDELAGFWAMRPDRIGNPGPDAATRERLIEVIDKRPELLASVAELLPPRDEVCARVKRAMAKFEQESAEEIDKWLVCNCASEHARLIATASSAKDEDGWVRNSEEIEALASASWNDAEPVLRQLAGSSQPRVRALALSLLFAHDGSADTRRALQSIAIDPNAPGFSRDRAIETLSQKEWSGRDEWLIGLMSDASLRRAHDGYTSFAPLESVAAKNPDVWIPIMTRLLASPDRDVHLAAVNALGQFYLERARADALRPLLPWLMDPLWGDQTSTDARLRLIQSVFDLGITEAIPGLVSVVENDLDEYQRSYAAEALAQFKDPRGSAAMRKALEKEGTGDNRMRIAGALIDLGGFSAEELLAGMEASLIEARKSNEPMQFRLITGKGLSTGVMIGAYVVTRVRSRDDVARLAIARADELRTKSPELAQDLLRVVQTWNVPSVNALLLERIESGTASASMIETAIGRRETLRKSGDVKRLLAKQGIVRGIAMVIAGAASLTGDDHEALRAMLAGARVAGDELPVSGVAALFGRTSALDAAAEAYLIANDSPEARAIVQKRHASDIRILGSRLAWDPGDDTYNSFDAWERDLLARFRKSGADEVIALSFASAWSAATTSVEIVIKGDRARIAKTTLSAATLAELRAFLEQTRFDDLGPVDTGVIDGAQYEYVHLTRTSGRRVFMNNPAHAPGSPYDELVRRLEALQ
ncbi:MAG TPA: hypothetical protein VMU84_11215 [Thermoanaerobaculia bacterium]|nr:hypothetical protein [Thermoanaerobaculia bacterium]